MNRAIASSLQKYRHLTAFEDVTAERIEGIDPAALLVYLLDTVDASALQSLARQFDVDGLKGFGLATSETEQREVVAQAIDLVKMRGTAAGIRRALEAIGYPNSAVQERTNFMHNGVVLRDGTRNHGAGAWATFAVWVNNDLEPSTPADLQLIRQMVDIYKNARSTLVRIVFAAAVFDYDGQVLPNILAVEDDGTQLVINAIPPADFDVDSVDHITFNNVNYDVPVTVINL